MSATARVFVLMALCVLPALVSARPMRSNFIVQGRVYCDTCRAGFETSASTYIHGIYFIICIIMTMFSYKAENELQPNG